MTTEVHTNKIYIIEGKESKRIKRRHRLSLHLFYLLQVTCITTSPFPHLMFYSIYFSWHFFSWYIYFFPLLEQFLTPMLVHSYQMMTVPFLILVLKLGATLLEIRVVVEWSVITGRDLRCVGRCNARHVRVPILSIWCGCHIPCAVPRYRTDEEVYRLWSVNPVEYSQGWAPAP